MENKQERMLLHVHADKVNNDVTLCKKAHELLVELNHLLIDANVVIPLSELKGIITDSCLKIKQNLDFESYISDVLRSIIVENNFKNGNISLSGVPLSKAKLKELVEIPNFNSIKEIIKSFDLVMARMLLYMEIKHNAIILKADFEKLIADNYSVYAVGRKQIEAYERLNKLKDALNNWFEFADFKGVVDVRGIRVKGVFGELCNAEVDLDEVLRF